MEIYANTFVYLYTDRSDVTFDRQSASDDINVMYYDSCLNLLDSINMSLHNDAYTLYYHHSTINISIITANPLTFVKTCLELATRTLG